MKKQRVIAAAIAMAACALSTAAPAEDKKEPEPDFKFTGNMTLASEYLYRGLAQTNNKPAIQGGFDMTHSSGFYVGNWNSNISWLSDANPGLSAPIEMDFYGGYKIEIPGGVTLDPGVLYYYYPKKGVSLAVDPSTLEVYLGASWGPGTFKYSYSTSELFGTAGTRGSSYFDLSATFNVPGGVAITPHVGRQQVSTDGATPLCTDGSKDFSYYDYNVKATYDLSGWTLGAMVSDTNAKKACYTGLVGGTELGKLRVVLSVGKSF
jgi:uncharacterized protein (TIGR02001 family)